MLLLISFQLSKVWRMFDTESVGRTRVQVYFFRRMCSGTGFLGLVGGNMCTTADGIARWTHFILILASAFILTRTWIQNSFINWHFTTSRHWESWSQSRSQSWRQRIRIWSWFVVWFIILNFGSKSVTRWRFVDKFTSLFRTVSSWSWCEILLAFSGTSTKRRSWSIIFTFIVKSCDIVLTRAWS